MISADVPSGSGPDRTTLARMVLIGLNAFAVVVPLIDPG